MTSDVSKHRAVRQHHATSRPGSTRSRPRGECDGAATGSSRHTLSKLGSRPLEGNAAGLASLHDSQIGGQRGGAPSCTPWRELALLACGGNIGCSGFCGRGGAVFLTVLVLSRSCRINKARMSATQSDFAHSGKNPQRSKFRGLGNARKTTSRAGRKGRGRRKRRAPGQKPWRR